MRKDRERQLLRILLPCSCLSWALSNTKNWTIAAEFECDIRCKSSVAIRFLVFCVNFIEKIKKLCAVIKFSSNVVCRQSFLFPVNKLKFFSLLFFFFSFFIYLVVLVRSAGRFTDAGESSGTITEAAAAFGRHASMAIRCANSSGIPRDGGGVEHRWLHCKQLYWSLEVQTRSLSSCESQCRCWSITNPGKSCRKHE